jgi:dienelactone hydrolase
MTKIGIRRAALVTVAFLTLTITAFTITVAAQSRDTQIAEFSVDIAAVAQSNSPGRLKSKLRAEDEGGFSFRTTAPWKGNKTNIRGTLEFPANAPGRVPLVMVVHSADGIDAAERGWVSFWHQQGYATFLLDYMTPRNAGPNADPNGGDIPNSPQDIADALKVLATHPRIDTGRVAVQGLSHGATMTVGSGGLIRAKRIGIAPKAYIMLYGGCNYNLVANKITDAAYLFMVGDKDTLIPASLCTAKEELGAKHGKDVRTVIFPGAYHGFDGNAVKDIKDRRFGHVVMKPNRTARNQARIEAGALLKRVFSSS